MGIGYGNASAASNDGSTMDSVPVIVGSGISGLFVSDQLARADVPHLLVASDPPDTTSPRLGESLNLHGTIALKKHYPEAEAYLVAKEGLYIYLAEQRIWCDFDFTGHLLRRLGFQVTGTAPLPHLVHLDRTRFDRTLYDRVVAHPRTEVVRTSIESVETADDRVTRLQFSNGRAIAPSYVFDATNRARVLSGPLGIGATFFGDAHLVVFTHFISKRGAAALDGAEEEWTRATSIIRLYPHLDGIDAVAWCIPLCWHVSVGISLQTPAEIEKEELIEKAVAAFARVGIGPRRYFSEPGEILSVNNRYFILDRAAGPNWMLVGPAFCSIWWPSSTGLGGAMAAAEVAVQAIDHPLEFGGSYESYMRTLVGMHQSVDGLLAGGKTRLDEETFRRERVRRNISEIDRWLKMQQYRKNPLIRYTEPVRNVFLRPLLRVARLCTLSEFAQGG